MSVLITGGCGFVGINLAEALLAAGERVVLFDRIALPRSAFEALASHGARLSVVGADIRDSGKLQAALTDYAVRRIVHAAVITADAGREAREAATIVDVNIGGALNVLQAARAAKCERVVYVGSAQAYGATHEQGIRLREETSPSRPQDIYGITKFGAEQIALRLSALWKLEVICVRLGSVCGPWEFDTGVRDMLSPYLRTAQLALRGEAAIIPRREFWRDWVYSRDVGDGLRALLRARALRHRVYHLSSGIDWQGSFARWCYVLGKAYPQFTWRTAAIGEPPNVSFVVERDRAPMDVSRIASDVGFTPKFGPREAHADYIGWIREHEDSVRGSEEISKRELNAQYPAADA